MFKSTGFQAIVLLAVGGLLGYLTASGHLGLDQPAEAAPPPLGSQAEQKSPAQDKDASDPPRAPAKEGTKSSQDTEAIRRSAREFELSFNKGDAKGVAACWTEEGEYIDESGRAVTGRAAIADAYADFFAQHKGAKIQIVIDSLRLLGENAAIEDGRAVLDPPPQGPPGGTQYTAVHTKVDGKWRMASVRDTRLPTASAYHRLADLEWLIGTWTAEENGAKTESVCRWVANKSFVERSYTVTGPDNTTTSGVQLIGFNPQGGHIQSWNFSSDGGHAVGIWTPRQQGWNAEISGMLGDGTPTTATNLLTKLDDNAYAWQSVHRTLGGQSLPDTGEIVIKRVSSAY